MGLGAARAAGAAGAGAAGGKEEQQEEKRSTRRRRLKFGASAERQFPEKLGAREEAGSVSRTQFVKPTTERLAVFGRCAAGEKDGWQVHGFSSGLRFTATPKII